MSERKSILKDKSFLLAIRIVRLNQQLTEMKKEYILSKQLLRSGTAIGALIREAQNAESSKDFIHKLSISQKECDESVYWFELLKATEYINEQEFESLNNDAIELLKMLQSSIITSKQNHS
jgi:four helix bundle protein